LAEREFSTALRHHGVGPHLEHLGKHNAIPGTAAKAAVEVVIEAAVVVVAVAEIKAIY
jgi:hypothetical protein